VVRTITLRPYLVTRSSNPEISTEVVSQGKLFNPPHLEVNPSYSG
jgi:hypothetical protein